jgi:hypothetical protein
VLRIATEKHPGRNVVHTNQVNKPRTRLCQHYLAPALDGGYHSFKLSASNRHVRLLESDNARRSLKNPNIQFPSTENRVRGGDWWPSFNSKLFEFSGFTYSSGYIFEQYIA